MVVRVLMVHIACAGGSMNGSVDTDTPADFSDSCGTNAEVDGDSTVGVTGNIHITGCIHI